MLKKQIALICLTTILISGCESLPLVAAGASLAASTTQYKAAQKYKEVADAERVKLESVISKDCLLANYIQVNDKPEVKFMLMQTANGKKLLQDIAKNNKKLVEKCPNIDKPDS